MAKIKNFEKSLSRLQEITQEMENDKTDLEKSFKLYKEGVELALSCSNFLEKVEQDVFVLQRTIDEKFELTPFENLDEF